MRKKIAFLLAMAMLITLMPARLFAASNNTLSYHPMFAPQNSRMVEWQGDGVNAPADHTSFTTAFTADNKYVFIAPAWTPGTVGPPATAPVSLNDRRVTMAIVPSTSFTATVERIEELNAAGAVITTWTVANTGGQFNIDTRATASPGGLQFVTNSGVGVFTPTTAGQTTDVIDVGDVFSLNVADAIIPMVFNERFTNAGSNLGPINNRPTGTETNLSFAINNDIYILTSPVLQIELRQGVAKGSQFILELNNAEWFFRQTS
jgi:hypothetical protein